VGETFNSEKIKATAVNDRSHPKKDTPVRAVRAVLLQYRCRFQLGYLHPSRSNGLIPPPNRRVNICLNSALQHWKFLRNSLRINSSSSAMIWRRSFIRFFQIKPPGRWDNRTVSLLHGILFVLPGWFAPILRSWALCRLIASQVQEEFSVNTGNCPTPSKGKVWGPETSSEYSNFTRPKSSSMRLRTLSNASRCVCIRVEPG